MQELHCDAPVCVQHLFAAGHCTNKLSIPVPVLQLLVAGIGCNKQHECACAHAGARGLEMGMLLGCTQAHCTNVPAALLILGVGLRVGCVAQAAVAKSNSICYSQRPAQVQLFNHLIRIDQPPEGALLSSCQSATA